MVLDSVRTLFIFAVSLALGWQIFYWLQVKCFFFQLLIIIIYYICQSENYGIEVRFVIPTLQSGEFCLL
jgi:hypothetical protein